MTVQCVDCQRFSLRQAPAMAKHGFGNCNKLPAHEYKSAIYQRECPWFTQEKEQTVALRREYVAKRSGVRNANTE